MNEMMMQNRLYSMKEIMKETGLSDDTLRYYEKDGILSDIHRLPNGHRQYGEDDLEWLKFVLCLRSTGMPLKKIRMYKELMEQGDKTAAERRALLLCQKERLLKEMNILQDALSTINYKIEYYDSL
jgi:DNA-binding transcriptional MerR regulator